jgi:DNA recombination protein RmuC
MSALWLLVGMALGVGIALALRRAVPARPPEAVLEPVQEGLRRLDAQLRDLDRERHASGGRLEAQLHRLFDAQEALRAETGALAGALRRPNARGQWGQVQLRRVVELAGMVAHCDFCEQPTLASGLRPDLIVTLPGGRRVVVDAKVPLDAVLDAEAAADVAERRAHLATHARALRSHVAALAARAYADELPDAPELVVLFLPGEHLYGAALEADPALLEEAMARRVLIATPTTLLAVLRAIAYGWQEQQVGESARAVGELGRELHRRLARLSGLLAAVGTRLNGAVRAYNEAIGSYEARIVPAARRLAEHGAAGGGEVEAPAQLAVAARAPAGEPYALSDAGPPARADSQVSRS